MKNKNRCDNVKVICVARNNLILLFVAVLLFILASFCKPVFLLDQNQILYLFSASAQVLAAVYGLVLTAFSFVQGSIEKRGAKDPDLEGIWDRMNQKCFKMLIYISIMTFLSIVLCMITMSSYDERNICKFFANVSIVFTVNDLYLIIKFVIRFANPKWEDTIRGEVIKEFGGNDVKSVGSGNDNSVQLFLAYFQKIERALGKASAPFINYNRYSRSRFVSKKEMLMILLKNGYFKNDNIVPKILDLIPFRNSLVHSSIEQGVPDEMMRLVKEVLENLKEALKETKELRGFDWDVKLG
ncbi:hypothetical protein SAMN06298224_2741 [Fibrobacter sp. UWB16]|uniref:hypothetical protein n=1 Tax=Fibrobacter sp. UWB16 TaxID=1945874 RepID=UPI000BC39633|nr:hypothetical protein [Fibrobacter sp. UWB16]SOD17159.1 hypothetical protein SAMN06298224_2741 [Fibrobacter sp. UWB16]